MAVNEFLEFKKQYEGTFLRVQFEKSNVKRVFTVRNCIDDDAKKPYLVLHNKEVGECAVNWKETKQNIDYSFPQVGLFNHGPSFLMFHRFPDRQWKRGISSGNSHIADPLRDIKLKLSEYYGYVASQETLTSSTLESAFSEQYPLSFTEAVSCVQEGKQLGVALSPVFGLTKSPTKQFDIIVWKHLNMIGHLRITDRMICCVEDTFSQELSDHLNRTKETAWTLQ